jgi:hypothetical protein
MVEFLDGAYRLKYGHLPPFTLKFGALKKSSVDLHMVPSLSIGLECPNVGHAVI